MNNPQILGRALGEDPAEARDRSTTSAVATVEVPYCTGAIGTARVEVFTSDDDEDRGGIVLRFLIEDHSCSFVPLAKNLENGVELHLSGEAEAQSLIRALMGALAASADLAGKKATAV